MRALVTGGAGFLGGHVARALLERGASVAALDDASTGSPANVPCGSRFVAGDVRDATIVDRCVREADVVYHLAAAVGARVVAEDPAGTWSRNVLGTARVLEACAARGVRTVVASTSEVYGPPRPAPFREDDPVALEPAARRDVYALSKAAGEAYAFALHRATLLPVTVVRLFNVVGPGQSARYGMVLPRFVAAARRGRPLPVHGDGTQRRCFLHVADAVDALLALAACPAAEGLAVNVGSEEETSVLDVARHVLLASGSGAGVEFVPFERVYGEGFADPQRRRPDVARLRALVGWAPRRTLLDAVHDLLAAVPA